MTWIRLEDDFPHHPDVWALPANSSWLFVAALCYSRHHLTDGFIPASVLSALCRGANRRWVAPLLADHWVEVDGGWQIRNYDRYQQTREEVERSREAGRDRATRSRERKRDRGVPPSTEVEEELDNPPLPPHGGEDLDCERCEGRGVYFPDHEATAKRCQCVAGTVAEL